MKSIVIIASLLALLSTASANQISESQLKYVKVYEKQTQITAADQALLNLDKEPDLEHAFTDLYNGKNLDGWTPRGGECTFEAKGESIVGTCKPGSPSTYLSTDRADYTDFIFSAEFKWAVDGNTGVMFRAQSKPGKKFETVFGPQAEMEGVGKDRGWSGGIYGQSAGGWRYPLWLDEHKQARAALKKDAWNRITIQAIGTDVKTWINGVPAAHWVDDEFQKGFFSLQVHAGKQGTIHYRNIKVKELSAPEEMDED